MAGRRRKVRPGRTQRRRQALMAAPVLALVLAVVACVLRMCREPQQQEGAAAPVAGEQPAAEAEVDLRAEVEARRAAAMQRSLDRAEEARRKEAEMARAQQAAAKAAAEQQRRAAPEPAEEEPQPAPEPAQEEPQEEPPAPEEPQPAPQPAAEPDAPAEGTQEPEPTPPSETPVSAGEADPEGLSRLINPYSGNDYSLQSSASQGMKKKWEDMVDDMLSRRQTEAFAKALEVKIAEALPELLSDKRFKLTEYSKNAYMVGAVEYCYMFRALGEKKLRAILSLRDANAYVKWLMLDKLRPLHRILQAHKYNSGVREVTVYNAIDTLYKIKRHTTDWNISRYMNLALACSLLHPQVAKGDGRFSKKVARKDDKGEKEDVLLKDITEVFSFYQEGDSGRKLRAGYDLKKMSVFHLLYVVDARLPKDEYEWVHKTIMLPRAKWKQLYDSLNLVLDDDDDDTARSSRKPAVKRPSLLLAEIKANGGTNADRAYYAAITAKCVGMPAVIVTGDGIYGEHRWAGVMSSDRAWTQVGAYDYNTGYIHNPCANEMQHMSTIFNVDRNQDEDHVQPALDGMLLSELLALMGNKPKEAMSVASGVTTAYPRYATGWLHRVRITEMVEKQLGEKEQNEDPWLQLYQDMERCPGKSSTLVDLMQEVYLNHLAVKLRGAAKVNALRRVYKKLTNPMTGRVDLLLECVRQQADVYAYEDNKKELLSFYRLMFREHKWRGDIFAKLVEQSGTMGSFEDPELYKKLAREAENIYSKPAYNDNDYFRMKLDYDVMCSIAALYEKGGDSHRATLLRDDGRNRMNIVRRFFEDELEKRRK